MEANTNTAPEDITQIQHQTASWQVCWWAQTRLRVKTQLLPSDILNFCPTKSSHILSGLENLPFPPEGTQAERRKEWKTENSAAQKEWNMSYNSPFTPATRCLHHKGSLQGPAIFIWAQSDHRQPHRPVLHSKLLSGHTSDIFLTFSCQQVWVHTINLEQESGRVDGGGEFVGGGRGGETGSEDSDRSEGSCPFSTSVFLHNPPHRPPAPSQRGGGDSWCGTFERPADWLQLFCTNQVRYAEMFLRTGTAIYSRVQISFARITWT